MAGRVALERFAPDGVSAVPAAEVPEAAAAPAPCPGATGEDTALAPPVPGSGVADGSVAEDESEGQDGEAGSGTGADPETATACGATELARLADAIARLDAELGAMRAQAQAEAARRAGAAMAAALPHLARTRFAEEAAAAAAALAGSAGPGEARLECAPADREAIGKALAAAGGPGHIDPVTAADLPAGSLRIAWAEGGAELSADALAEAVLTRFREAFRTDPAEETTP